MKGNSDSIVSQNIRDMRNAGHPEAQAVAASLRAAGRGAKKGSQQSRNRVIKPSSPGQKPLKFKEGGLHASTGTPAGQKISPAEHAKAASGKLGPLAAKQENFYRNVLQK